MITIAVHNNAVLCTMTTRGRSGDEALWWVDRKDKAKKQFAVAAHLDLTVH